MLRLSSVKRALEACKNMGYFQASARKSIPQSVTRKSADTTSPRIILSASKTSSPEKRQESFQRSFQLIFSKVFTQKQG
jgi:hypothetical protein